MNQASIVGARDEWRQSWTVVAATMSGVALSTVSQASTGVMMEPLEAEFGWTRVQISSGAALVSVTTLFLSVLAGLAIDKLGPRRIAIAAVSLMLAATAAMSTIDNALWQWWGLWILVGVASACMPTVWLSVVSRLFTKGRGLAMAVTLSGSGISTFLVPIVANQLVENYGWRGGYLGLAAIWGMVVLPLVLLCFHPPRQAAAKPGEAARPPEELPGLTVQQGFRSPSFYKLAIAAFLSTVGGVAMILNLMPILTFTGIDRASAAVVAGSVGLATITGRVFGGWLMDFMNAKYIAAASTFGALTLPIVLLAMPGSVPAAAFGVITYGLLGGAKIGAIAYLASKHLGAKSFGTLYGAVNTMLALAVAIAPVSANYVYDLTKSYTPVMWAALPILALATLVYLSLGRYPDFQPGTSK